MTHMGPLPDSAGDFADWKPDDLPCRKCGGHVLCRCWESSDGAYEDYQYKCQDCGHVWWIDGIDS